jgi:hypothetical protein
MAGGGRSRSARPQLGATEQPEADAGRPARGDRGPAAAADDRGRDRRGARYGALDGLQVAEEDRARQTLGPGAPGAPEPLRAQAPGRADPRRREEARPDPPCGPSGHRPPPRAGPAPPGRRPPGRHGRLGVRPRLRRRRHPPGLRGGPGRREGSHGGGLPTPCGRLVRRHGDHGRAGALRQRRLLSLASMPPPARSSGSGTCALAPTGPRPTARPSASSRP